VYRLGLEQLSGFLELSPRTGALSPYGRRRRTPRPQRSIITPALATAGETE
jgi:hypothetical protein